MQGQSKNCDKLIYFIDRVSGQGHLLIKLQGTKSGENDFDFKSGYAFASSVT
jgi:hypothetical protein